MNLGFSSQHKGYKCLSRSGKLYITKHVVFDELVFPFKIYSEGFLIAAPSAATPALQSMVSLIPVLHSAPSSPSGSGPSVAAPSNPAVPTPPVTQAPPFPSVLADAAPSVPAANQKETKKKPQVVNTHNMQTWAKAGIRKPKVYAVTLEPKSAKEALSIPHWKQAMDEEFAALMRNKTWKLVQLPPNRRAIGSKWVFRVKYHPDGSISKYKARLVAQGFNQREGFDFTETFSPVVKPTTIRLILTLALSRGWSIRQLDVNNAFLNGDLQEDVYMVQPKGFEVEGTRLVCKLTKALYGLKQAPRAWFSKLSSALQQYGFKFTRSDVSLFTQTTTSSITYILVYVDDIIITGSSPQEIAALIQHLNSNFALKDMGPLHYFL